MEIQTLVNLVDKKIFDMIQESLFGGGIPWYKSNDRLKHVTLSHEEAYSEIATEALDLFTNILKENGIEDPITTISFDTVYRQTSPSIELEQPHRILYVFFNTTESELIISESKYDVFEPDASVYDVSSNKEIIHVKQNTGVIFDGWHYHNFSNVHEDIICAVITF
jgi:hypothetical protein